MKPKIRIRDGAGARLYLEKNKNKIYEKIYNEIIEPEIVKACELYNNSVYIEFNKGFPEEMLSDTMEEYLENREFEVRFVYLDPVTKREKQRDGYETPAIKIEW